MTPFQQATFCEPPEQLIKDLLNLPETRSALGIDRPPTRSEVLELIDSTLPERVFKNDLYQVAVNPTEGLGWPMVHLSIKRIDRQPIHDWRHLQQIKNEILGPDWEGLELYPAESRKLDAANQFHISIWIQNRWCDGPVRRRITEPPPWES